MDRELAALAHEAQGAPDDPAPRLRWATALERLGRRDEATAALVPVAWRSAEARTALARSPGWSATHADAGHRRWVDLPPVGSEPRVLWRAPGPVKALVANPYAVVVAAKGRARVLDLETGAERYAFAADADAIQLVGDVLLSERRTFIEARDLGTGELLWRRELLVSWFGGPVGWLHAGGSLVCWESQAVRGFVCEEARRPTCEAAWTEPCEPDFDDIGLPGAPTVLAAGETVYVFEDWEFRWEMRALVGGRVAWKRAGQPRPQVADEHGVFGVTWVSGRRKPGGLVARTAAGDADVLEADEYFSGVQLLTPDRIGLATTRATLLLDRATFARVGEGPYTLAGARDVIYAASAKGVGPLHGAAIAGLPHGHLAVAPRRLLAAGDEGVACIG